jgi:hypothetical protein
MTTNNEYYCLSVFTIFYQSLLLSVNLYYCLPMLFNCLSILYLSLPILIIGFQFELLPANSQLYHQVISIKRLLILMFRYIKQRGNRYYDNNWYEREREREREREINFFRSVRTGTTRVILIYSLSVCYYCLPILVISLPMLYCSLTISIVAYQFLVLPAILNYYQPTFTIANQSLTVACQSLTIACHFFCRQCLSFTCLFLCILTDYFLAILIYSLSIRYYSLSIFTIACQSSLLSAHLLLPANYQVISIKRLIVRMFRY